MDNSWFCKHFFKTPFWSYYLLTEHKNIATINYLSKHHKNEKNIIIKLDIPEDIFGHQICLRKECWKLQRKKKKKSKQICKNWIFCKQTADIGCWKMFVYNYYYNKMFCFVHWALSSSQIIRKLKKILSLFWNMLENEKKYNEKKIQMIRLLLYYIDEEFLHSVWNT